MRKKLMAGPYLLWMLVFTIVPLLFVFYYGFTSSDGTFTFSNITAIFEKIHIQALGLSLLLAVITTAVCLLFAYPLALILSKSAAKNRSFVIFIFILPMWINFLLRIIAIRMLLSDNGILNYILSALNLPNFSIMYTPAAIVIGMVYDYLPSMIMPIYSIMAKMDNKLLEAAKDLGCNNVAVLRRVIWPLSLPGVISGITMVLVPSISTFYISQKLGNGKFYLIGDAIEGQYVAGNLHFAAAIAFIFMVILLACMALANQWTRRHVYGGA